MSDETATFGSHFNVPLTAGAHTVTVTQTVTIGGKDLEGYRAAQPFALTAPRYTLAPDALQAVYPPRGSRGAFADTLPYVVLTQPSLPWLRSPGVPGKSAMSWLAVLLFDAADPPPQPQAVPVGEVVPVAPRFGPPRAAEAGDPPGPVTVIDVPLALFWGIVPHASDLTYAAHVRRGAVAAKATAGDSAPPADYAVVLGNRLPSPGSVSTAHLVSLEGLGPYLPDVTNPKPVPSGTAAVRLVSLASWSFGAQSATEGETFAGALLSMSAGPLRRPVGAWGSASAAAQKTVADALAAGYTAHDHQLRNGDATVSWYRGPLLPLAGKRAPAAPFAAADELLRYDPAIGMLDVSYSAAWTLGRLLALRDNGFATSLYRWKLDQTQAAVEQLEREAIDGLLPDPATVDEHRLARAAKALVPSALESLEGRG